MTLKIASFKELEPDLILKAIETSDCRSTGWMSQLNSYENRVFEVGIEPRDRRVIKFYRPGRWSKECIREEHNFLLELEAQDIQVGAPLPLAGQERGTVGLCEGLFYAVFPRVRGRMADEFDESMLRALGRILARIHNVGAQRQFMHRPVLHEKPFSLWENLELLAPLVSVELWPRYEAAAVELIDAYEEQIVEASFQRIHGDFHRGNVLLDRSLRLVGGAGGVEVFNDEFVIVDFDDCARGPVVQDLWMLLGNELESEQGQAELKALLEGYNEFRKFPMEQLAWVPLLRGARILSYAAWIARRWSDPSFVKLFPEFGSHKYWSVETEALERILRLEPTTRFN